MPAKSLAFSSSMATYMGALIMIVTMLFSSYASARNSFLVAPGRVDFDLNRPQTQSFIITNNGDGKIRLTITPIYFPIDDKSLAAGKHINSETAKIEDITSAVRVAPKTLSLRPGQRRDIRISVRPPKDLAEGDYRTHLLVSMKEIAKSFKGNTESENSVGMQLNLKMETAVAIYGRVGERDPKLEISCNKGDQQSFKVLNKSPWRFDGVIQFYPENSATATYEDRVVSLRESENTFRIKTPLKGNYMVRWIDFKTQSEVGSTTCTL